MGHLRVYKSFSRKAGKPQSLKRNFLCAFAPLRLCVTIAFALLFFSSSAQRQDILLNTNWLTSLNNTNQWKTVSIPHNWDDYYGYRRLVHGNLHGDAVYKKTFPVKTALQGKRVFLFFEGVGSYATVFVNNKPVGSHAGGRTTFTLDITDAVKSNGSANELLVKVAHPSNIKDLPWVCGACSDDRGFSEGSQPLGIFRPVHLIITNDTRIEPFGIHAVATIKTAQTTLWVNTTIKNYSLQNRHFILVNQLVQADGKIVAAFSSENFIKAKDSIAIASIEMPVADPILWTLENPYLYKVISIIKENNTVIDKAQADFGFRTINWKAASHQFILNGKPVFINGIAEYEHALGQSHAFSNEEIQARMKWIQSAGFNAFRDAHQPHNFLYGKFCDEKGLLWWTQFSAHVWYDTKAFRENFKILLKEWVIERRNDPALILWGLQNESKLPKDFAEECTQLIRRLDPTASSQRLVTTCNGGEGTDWDVPQNWTGTYGGDPATYAQDIKKQVLIGEYGAWRTLDLHTEGGFVQNGVLSEDRMVQLMEQKIRLAESVKDSCAGQFFWLLSSHDNPGRVQGGEGLRELDRVGPVNYKGLFTPWEEPTDAYYMFRSNYVSNAKEPMVYIVSHTWPNRWMAPGIKDSINVYSNCDEVELFNDIDNASLGKQKRNGLGTHFQWNKVNIQYNLLYAVGYVNGKPVARDTITLFHLPQSPHYDKLYANARPITKPSNGYNYAYRVNCGGPAYKDENGNTWLADKNYSASWTDDFPGMPQNFASQRRTFAPVKNTHDWKLFQTFRYGKEKLKYAFDVEDGNYMVELYFIEPWLGIGGSNAKGMRMFDVAINGKTVIHDLDIWSEAGPDAVLKKTVTTKISGGKIIISFPQCKAGQAVIAAIAIARQENFTYKRSATKRSTASKMNSWLDIGDKVFANENIQFNSLPSSLFGAGWLQLHSKDEKKYFNYHADESTDLFFAVKQDVRDNDMFVHFENTHTQIITDENSGTLYTVYRKRLAKDDSIAIDVNSNIIVCLQPVTNMQPAYDLKPVTPYRTAVAIVSGGMQKETIAGRECAVVKDAGVAAVQWPVQTGVADIYSITVKYFYPGEKTARGKVQLADANNTLLHEEEVEFSFTRTGKWNQLTFNTGTMINAGNYTIKLMVENAAGLAVSGIDIQ